MNKLGTVLFLILVFTFSSCQTQVPKGVKVAFEEKYAGEKHSKWEVDRNGNYESHFKKDGKEYRADFSPEGEWIETERSIKKKDLPKIVREILKADYDDYKIVELEETQHHSKGLFYDVELKKDGKKQDVEFNKEGEILN
ncbi:PepSY-like domain-containing protein [Aurantibacter crassamenti]|nr:PepSY-like domain-containing protein [Aurantibacter crassamenti]